MSKRGKAGELVFLYWPHSLALFILSIAGMLFQRNSCPGRISSSLYVERIRATHYQSRTVQIAVGSSSDWSPHKNKLDMGNMDGWLKHTVLPNPLLNKTAMVHLCSYCWDSDWFWSAGSQNSSRCHRLNMGIFIFLIEQTFSSRTHFPSRRFQFPSLTSPVQGSQVEGDVNDRKQPKASLSI